MSIVYYYPNNNDLSKYIYSIISWKRRGQLELRSAYDTNVDTSRNARPIYDHGEFRITFIINRKIYVRDDRFHVSTLY